MEANDRLQDNVNGQNMTTTGQANPTRVKLWCGDWGDPNSDIWTVGIPLTWDCDGDGRYDLEVVGTLAALTTCSGGDKVKSIAYDGEVRGLDAFDLGTNLVWGLGVPGIDHNLGATDDRLEVSDMSMDGTIGSLCSSGHVDGTAAWGGGTYGKGDRAVYTKGHLTKGMTAFVEMQALVEGEYDFDWTFRGSLDDMQIDLDHLGDGDSHMLGVGLDFDDDGGKEKSTRIRSWGWPSDVTIEYKKQTEGHNSEAGMKHDVIVRLPSSNFGMELKATVDKGDPDITATLKGFPQIAGLRIDLAQEGDHEDVRSFDLIDKNSADQFERINVDGTADGFRIDGKGLEFERARLVQGPDDHWTSLDGSNIVLLGLHANDWDGELGFEADKNWLEQYDGYIENNRHWFNPPEYRAVQRQPCNEDSPWKFDEGTKKKEDCFNLNGHYYAIDSVFWGVCKLEHDDGLCA